jgi:hypothetical protein
MLAIGWGVLADIPGIRQRPHDREPTLKSLERRARGA